MQTVYEICRDFKNGFNYSMKEVVTFTKYVTTDNFNIQGIWDKICLFVGNGHVALSEDLKRIAFILIFLFLTWITFYRIMTIMRARNCKVNFAWNNEKTPRVGDVGILRVSFFLTGECFQFFRPSNPEATSKLLKELTVRVVLDHEEVVVEKDASDIEQSIFLKFPIHRSGKYEINILYNGFPVYGSPFTALVEPDEMDPSNTTIDWTMPIVMTQGKMSTLEILPKDKYGNRCSARSDDLNRLTFEFRQILGDGFFNHGISGDRHEVKSSFSLRRDFRSTEKILEIVSFHLKPEIVGVFVGQIMFNGIPLNSEQLEIISISPKEEIVILEKEHQERNLSSTYCEEFKATMANGKDVVVELSPRFFYLKDMVYDGILQSRIATFRVCKQTVVKIVSSFTKDDIEMYKIKILDEVQNQSQVLDMTAIDARIFMVLISRFCSNGENDFLRLETKRMHLYKELRSINLENPRIAYKILKIRRDELVQSTLDETRHFNREDWGKPFVVSFYGESVKTEKLAWLDWSESLLDLFFENNSFGMFYSLRTSDLVHPNPSRNIRWTREHYELAGKVVGKYLIETALDADGSLQYYTNARLSRSFLAQILSLKPTYKHMELDDPEVYASTIEPILNNNVSGMNLTFTGPVYDAYGNMITRELIPNGSTIPVTNENKVTYLNALANLILAANVQEEVEAFVSGLTILVPNDLLMTFDENELELVLCGSSGFTTKEIQMYHISSGSQWNPFEDRIKEWLWTSLQKMSPLDIGRFLQFVTGSSRLPAGGLSALKPRLKITISCLFGQLPTSNKSLHQLSLTDHPDLEKFSRALITAIRSADENRNVMSQF